MSDAPDRNLAMELVRVTEAAAVAASRWQGRGDKNAVVQAAVDAIRAILATVELDGIFFIVAGAKYDSPWPHNVSLLGTVPNP